MMWVLLVCASFCELGFTVCMKLSDGFKNKKFTILTVLITALGIFLLSTATNSTDPAKIMKLISIGYQKLKPETFIYIP